MTESSFSTFQKVHLVAIMELLTVSHSLPHQLEFAILSLNPKFSSFHGQEILKVLGKWEF